MTRWMIGARLTGLVCVAGLLIVGCGGAGISAAPTSSAASAAPSPSATLGSPAPTLRPPSIAPGASTAGAWSIVTIGDSIPFAQGDCGGCPSFTTLFAAAIESATGRSVSAENLSTHDSLTGARLVDRIRNDLSFRTSVAGADIIVVTIGHNDTPWNSTDDPCDGNNPDGVFNWSTYTGDCVVEQAKRHGTELDAVLSEIEALRGGRPTAVRVTTDYNDIVGWDQAPPEAVIPSVGVVEAFARETCRVATIHHAVCVDVYHAFNGPGGTSAAGDLLAGDYTHPSAKGQALIADLLAKAGVAPLS